MPPGDVQRTHVGSPGVVGNRLGLSVAHGRRLRVSRTQREVSGIRVLQKQMAGVLRMMKQVATADPISETQRQWRRITCAAHPKPIALSAHSRRTLYPHHSGGSTPKRMTPRRDFTPAPVPTLCDHLVLTGRTASQSDRCSPLAHSATVTCQILGQAQSLIP